MADDLPQIPVLDCILFASPAALGMAAAGVIASLAYETPWWGTIITTVGIPSLFMWWMLILRKLP